MPVHDELNNAGLGWRVSLGRVEVPSPGDNQAPWVYDAPDGGRRGFYGRLHPGFPSTPETGVFYTNDGSYLRLRHFAGSASCQSPVQATNECVLLEFPNGVVHEFRNFSSSDPDYRITRMRDPFDNHVDVTYSEATWQISDSEGRTQTVEFTDASHTPRPGGPSERIWRGRSRLRLRVHPPDNRAS